MLKGYTRDLGVLIYLFPNKFLLKKDKVAKLGLVKFNFSCDWQLVCYKLESLLTGL